jgi:hypothetical protein
MTKEKGEIYRDVVARPNFAYYDESGMKDAEGECGRLSYLSLY